MINFKIFLGSTEIQKFEYLEYEKSFFDQTKTFFIVFERISIDEKEKFEKKIADKSFKYVTNHADAHFL